MSLSHLAARLSRCLGSCTCTATQVAAPSPCIPECRSTPLPLQDGQLLAPPEAAAPPNVTVASAGGLFTLLTLDPDAPGAAAL